MGWADSYRRLRIHANTNSNKDVLEALIEGADGIGCLSSDYLFRVDGQRIDLTRSILLASNVEQRHKLLQSM